MIRRARVKGPCWSRRIGRCTWRRPLVATISRRTDDVLGKGHAVTASPHFFDASASRPGGAPVDPAADPWGVRRAENLLTSLEGILSARVVTTPLGEVSEIHILANAGQHAKQVVRNVESALLAHLGLKVDHRKISVAATADVKPLQTLDLGAVRARAGQRVVLFEELAMATVPHARRLTATVTLAAEGRTQTVTEEES